MKKYQLLEKAMRDYPAGTEVKPPLLADVHVCSGVYKINGNDIECVKDGLDNEFLLYMDEYGWAEIIPAEPESILSGKCDIQVKNEREFKLLMEHYDVKCWRSKLGDKAITNTFIKYLTIIAYHDGFVWLEVGCDRGFDPEKIGYTVIPFADFAKEVGIEVPVFIMKSEDGVDLYGGDEFYSAKLKNGQWEYDDYFGKPYKITQRSMCHSMTDTHKAFTTREAAQKWIAEANKPKEIIVNFNKTDTPNNALVHKQGVHLRNGEQVRYCLSGEELEKVYVAYKSL